jgi:site-specific DNA recombinase
MADASLPAGASVVGYLRDSGGDNQDRSVPQQRQAIEAYCERHGLVLVRVFADEATSGGSSDRDAFQEMIRWLRRLAPEPERGPRDPDAPEGILYWDLRRFGRNQDDSAYYRADLRRRGYELVSLSDNIPAGDLAPVMEAMLSWKAEQDLKDLSRDVKRGLYEFMLTRGSDGQYLHCWTGRRPPGFRCEYVIVGARRDGQPRRARIIVPDLGAEADLVRTAFEMRAGGASYAEIHQVCRLRQARRAYRRMFGNTIYIGRLQYGDLDVEGWIEPMVDWSLWDAVQEQARAVRHPRLETAGYPLSGLLRCGECGGALTGKTNRLRRPNKIYVYRRYICRRAYEWTGCAMTHHLDADAIEAALYRVLSAEALTTTALARLMDGIETQPGHLAALKAEIARLETDLAGVDRALGRLVDAAEAGAGAIPVLADRLRTRQTERREVERALQDAQRRRDALDPEPVPAAVIAAFCEDLAQVLTAGDVVAVRRLLDQVVVEVRAWPDGRGEVDYRAPWPGGATGSARFSWV